MRSNGMDEKWYTLKWRYQYFFSNSWHYYIRRLEHYIICDKEKLAYDNFCNLKGFYYRQIMKNILNGTDKMFENWITW